MVRVVMKRRSCVAKIARPEIKKTHPRERLFLRFDAWDGPVQWISGPPGSGKTTLVSSYLVERNHAHLWYQLDERDADPAHFYHYLKTAAQGASRRKRSFIPGFSQEYLPRISVFNRRYFEQLFRQLISHDPCYIIFDNYQEMPAGSIMHDLIAQGLDMIPDNTHVMVLSREEPPPAFARLRANSKLALLGWNDLRLTLDESLAIAALRMREDLDENALASLHEMAKGWAAGLTLLLEAVEPGTVEADQFKELSNLSRAAVFDYLAGEFLAKFGSDEQKLLVKTAFLPQINLEAAGKLTGTDDAGKILSELSRKNYFTEKLAAVEPTYQYHPLLRAYLLSRKNRLLSPDEILDIRQIAAGLLEEMGAIEEAAELLIEAEDWNTLSLLIVKNASDLIAKGQTQTLEAWIKKVPEELRRFSPWLLFWQGTCCTPFNTAEGKILLKEAFSLFAKHNEPVGQLLAWAGVIDCFELEFADFTPLDHWIAVGEKLVGAQPEFPSQDVEVRVVSKFFSAMVFRQPHHPMLQTLEDRLNDLLQLIGDSRQGLMIGSSLVHRASWLGDIERAKWLTRLLRPSSVQEVAPLSMLMWYSLEAITHWITGDLQGCLATVEKGLDTSHRHGIHLLDVFLYSQGIYATLSAGDLDTASVFMQKMTAVMNPARLYDVSHYHFMAGWEAILREDLAQAFEHVQHALALSKRIGVPFAQGLGHIGLAQVLISLGDFEKVGIHLEEAHRIGKEMGSTILEYPALLTEAHLALQQKNEPECLRALRNAMKVGKTNHLVVFPWWRPRMMSRLCAKALEADIEVDYVKHLVQTRNLHPEGPSFGMERWPWRLKLYTLGRFELLRDEEPIRLSRKAQEKPLAILKALVASENGARPEHIADILWPEADGDAAYHAFQVTLHRLRSLTGYPEAIQSRHGRIVLEPGYWWVDAWAFEKQLEEADRHWKRGNSAAAVKRTESAVALYRGPFLGTDSEEIWAVRTRERLRNKFMHSVGKLGEHWSLAGEWETARECYQKGFDVDDLAEGFCQGLMVCYQRLGKRAEAIALYRYFEKRLESVLGVEPSRKTRALKDELLKNA